MKIVVVSDSHSNVSLLQDIKRKEYDADYFIHCGDYCIPDYLIDGYAKVLGNCDYSFDTPKQIDIATKYGIIHVEHGDNMRFYYNFEEYVESKDCFIFLYGHSHTKKSYKVGSTYVFNPGSLTRPRDDDYGSYLILNIDDNKEIKYEFIKIDLSKDEIIKG